MSQWNLVSAKKLFVSLLEILKILLVAYVLISFSIAELQFADTASAKFVLKSLY